MSLYNLHYLEFMATSHDKFWSHPRNVRGMTLQAVLWYGWRRKLLLQT